jgi:hypothetical protein
MDIAVHRIVSEELEAVGGSAVAALTQEWSPGGGMFFTSVEPRRPDAASLHVAYEDERTLNLTVGNIWIEIFGKVQDNLGYLREIVAAVLKGDVEEAGSPDNAFGRIHTASGTVHVGAMHLPLPWKLRKRRGYVPYNS